MTGDSAILWHAKGAVYLMQGIFAEASECFERAISRSFFEKKNPMLHWTHLGEQKFQIPSFKTREGAHCPSPFKLFSLLFLLLSPSSSPPCSSYPYPTPPPHFYRPFFLLSSRFPQSYSLPSSRSQINARGCSPLPTFGANAACRR